MQDLTVLVSGGAGYIGSHICKLLAEHKYKIIVIDDLSAGHEWAISKSAIFYKLDIGDSAEILKVLLRHNVKNVIHLAAFLDVNESVKYPLKYFQNNVIKSFGFLDACLQAKVENFVFSSTAAVYGNPKCIPVNEDAQLNPQSPYGFSKKIMEEMLQNVAKSHSLKFAILRYFNVAGAALNGLLGQVNPNATHLIKIASETACGKRAMMKVFGNDYATRDGTAERDYIHVEDLADIHWLALCNLINGGESDIFNCGYGKGHTVQEIIETMKKVSNTNFNVDISPRRLGDVECVVANSKKLQEKLGWKPRCDDIQLICKTAFDWERKQMQLNLV